MTLHDDFAAPVCEDGRPSIPLERLLRACSIQTLYSIRSERQLVQHIDYNLLYRWFVGLDMDDAVWDHSTFTKNRDRLLNETVARASSRKCSAGRVGETWCPRISSRWMAPDRPGPR